MTNGIVIGIFALIVAVFAVDLFWAHWGLPVMAGKFAMNLIDWATFWR